MLTPFALLQKSYVNICLCIDSGLLDFSASGSSSTGTEKNNDAGINPVLE
jgi:hypothetical protein